MPLALTAMGTGRADEGDLRSALSACSVGEEGRRILTDDDAEQDDDADDNDDPRGRQRADSVSAILVLNCLGRHLADSPHLGILPPHLLADSVGATTEPLS